MRRRRLNLFALHGTYFRDDENRLTANLAIVLNESRNRLLPAVLARLLLPADECERVEVLLQRSESLDKERSVIDLTLFRANQFVLIVESKIGQNSVQLTQAEKYARLLSARESPVRVLAFITQIHEPLLEAQIRGDLAKVFPEVRVEFLRWREIFELVEVVEELTPAQAARCERRIRAGRPVASSTRFCELFLEEVRSMAYSLCVVDDLTIGEADDVVIQAQDPWFMSVALKHNIWFPPSQSRFGLRPTKYVAYYRTAGNEQAGHITHVARLRKIWNRVTFDDVVSLPEFASMIHDQEIAAKVATFRNGEGLFHIAHTDDPVALANPIPLGDWRTAQFLTKKRLSLPTLLAARSTDDFLKSKRATAADLISS